MKHPAGRDQRNALAVRVASVTVTALAFSGCSKPSAVSPTPRTVATAKAPLTPTRTPPTSSAPTPPTPIPQPPILPTANLIVPTSVPALDRAFADDPLLFTRENEDGHTVLHLAAMRGDVAVVERMLQLGADVNARAKNGMGVTPLMAAAAGLVEDAGRRSMRPKGTPEGEWSVQKAGRRMIETGGEKDLARGPMEFQPVIGLLLERGADVNAIFRRRPKEKVGTNALHLVAMAGDGPMVDLLLKAGADVTLNSDESGTPLTAAAHWGNTDTIRSLLAAGVDVNSGDDRDRYLRGVRAISHPEALRLLLGSGMEVRPEWIRTASRKNGNAESLKELLSRTANQGDLGELLYKAAADSGGRDPQKGARLAETVQQLLDAGAPADAPDGTGEALVAAVARGNRPVAELLRARGVKVNWSKLRDDQHRPEFLSFAALFESHTKRLAQLESLGMPLDLTGAALLGRDEHVRELLTANPKASTDARGQYALYAAAAFGHVETCRILLDAGADANARTPGGDDPASGGLPLDIAVVRGHADVVKLLLERGADVKQLVVEDEDRKQLDLEILRMLEKAGFDSGRQRGGR